MKVMLDFILIGFAEPSRTGNEPKIQNGNICSPQVIDPTTIFFQIDSFASKSRINHPISSSNHPAKRDEAQTCVILCHDKFIYTYQMSCQCLIRRQRKGMKTFF